MLEVKHLRKKYRTKNGVITNALDDVSLTFSETGMVFILGKSGSGKSTLLNVCGGLDKPDSGEIVIKGKSSKDFTAQDFDSYRNTYVGFVFQEYNVLNEFSVEENIAIALELQNKKRDKAVIDKILADVDMRDFSMRKPNTLSGGQKQRVAIARALVKSPEIIMADEPTGALDSGTGKQVFDTLKNLSKEKLVLVVSHDRDFAEQYADRIIELKDGKVISDQVRTVRESGEDGEDGEKSNRNVRFFGTDTVCVERGSELTDDDMQSIKRFLTKSGGAAVISTSHERITSMKKDMPELDVGGFEELPEQPKSKTYAPQRLIRSHLPLHHAIRIGASGLKTKPVRLVFTILLSVMAFVIFGMASTLMMFNEKSVTVRTLVDNGDDYIILNKKYWRTVNVYDGDRLNYSYEDDVETFYTYAEYEEYKKAHAGTVASVDTSLQIDNIQLGKYAQPFYVMYTDGFILSDPSIKIVDGGGRLPAAADEIAVPQFFFDALRTDGSSLAVTDDDGNEETIDDIRTIKDILYTDTNKIVLNIGAYAFKIVGVYKSNDVPRAYAELKKAADAGREYTGNELTVMMWNMARRGGLYSRFIVTEEIIKHLVKRPVVSENIDAEYFDESRGINILYPNMDSDYVQYMQRLASDIDKPLLNVYNFDGDSLTSLAERSIAVSADCVTRSMISRISDYYEQIINNNESVGSDELEAAEAVVLALNDIYNAEGYYSPERCLPVYKSAYAFMKERELDFNVTLNSYDDFGNELIDKNVVIAGVFFDRMNYTCAYLSDELYEKYFYEHESDKYRTEYVTKYVVPEDAYISALLVPNTRATAEKLVNLTYLRGADDSSASIGNSIMDTLEIVFAVVEVLWKVFLVWGLVLALFAFLLMFNFISASITAKKKEIGVLRAIGARSVDVYKIFLSEALIISASCFVASCIIAASTCALINLILRTQTIINVSMFVFGPLSILCVLGIALVTSVLATLIPVSVYSKKPPVDSIRSL